MDDGREAGEAILGRCAAGELSPTMALMELLIVTEDASRAADFVHSHAPSSPPIQEMARLIEAHRGGCARIAAMLRSGVDSPPVGGSIEEGVAFCRRLFDWSVEQSEEASVALYSLGSADGLRAAPDEIVLQLERWGTLGPERAALDIGCGIGRMEDALGPRLREIHAIDVSENMITAARRRCAHVENARFSLSSGLDLRAFAAGRFDLAFAIDSFPYLVQSGSALVETHFAELARVLRPGGDLVVLNFSYRDDLVADRRDVTALCDRHGFDLLVSGTQPFSLWSGSAFRMRL